jgi:hypothetical protein
MKKNQRFAIRQWISCKAMLEYRRTKQNFSEKNPGDEPAIESPGFLWAAGTIVVLCPMETVR